MDSPLVNRRLFRPARITPALVTLAILLLGLATVLASGHIQDINPDSSTLDASNPNGAAGGRINGLAAVPGDNQIFYAASEWGGLFKSTDSGLTWFRLDAHLPVAMWDVEVSSADTDTVYATSFYDGRVNPLSGIEISTDAGSTWSRPADAQPNTPAEEGTAADNTPQAGFNCSQNRRTEPSAFGISIRPDDNDDVAIGTNCGVAISRDGGSTWDFFDPTVGASNCAGGSDACDVWDVVWQGGAGDGTIDICGDDRHYRSTNGGTTWTGGTNALPAGRCSLAVSPDEAYVLFVAAADNNVYESDDAGANWTNLGNQAAQGRIPFVVTNQRADDGDGNDKFDLWYSDTQLFRADCTTPATPAMGGANRCPTSASWTNQQNGAHWDGGDLVFDSEVGVDACPMLYSNDGGVYFQQSGCQSPTWEQPNVVAHAQWLFAMDGADQAGLAAEDLYFGNQDIGSFAATDAGSASPTWFNRQCCDVFDIAADSNRVLYTVCCFSPGRANRMFLRNPGMSGGGEINTYPSGAGLPGFRPIDIVDTFGNLQYVVVDGNGVWFTNDITASPIVWTQLGAATTPANACGVRSAVTGGTPTFYVQAGICNERTMGNGGDQLWSFTGTGAGNWTRIDNNLPNSLGVGIFGVDPNNPNRLYASNIRSLANGGPQMVFSTDGGATWQNDPELDTLMTGNGVFKYRTERGPSNFTRFAGYPQPTLAAYSAEDGNVLVAAGRDSGVFLSLDGGTNWSLVTDPFSGNVHLPRPWFAYFDHEPAGGFDVYLGTQGRGVWRLSFTPPTADAGGPYTTDEGVDVTLDGTGSTDDSGNLTYEWDLDGDGQFDDATGATVTFDMVGQDGVFNVSLKVTDPDGAYDVDTTTVTVDNVAPTVSLASNAPVDENSPVTVSGTISDPGWLDPLSATVDWGDGTPVENITGTLENERPDATLTFEVSHTYGDNGTFTAEVCGADDDTTTCETIALEIDNVIPTAEIDLSGTILINGIPTFLAHAGEPIDFSGRSTDPGSDDLTIYWNWGDGTPVESTDYLVNPPNPDPFPSPSIQPRDVTDMKTHTFADACLYEIQFWALDDDGGMSLVDTANVIIVGNADQIRSAGYWSKQFSQRGNTDFESDELLCYLQIAGYMSQVFDEVRSASTIAEALDILSVNNNQGTMAELLDRQLLAAWLNFANGAIEYDELVDTNFDLIPDAIFSDVMAAAEAVRLNPAAGDADLEMQKNILESVNLMHEDYEE